jgi:hypothetical protein
VVSAMPHYSANVVSTVHGVGVIAYKRDVDVGVSTANLPLLNIVALLRTRRCNYG